MTDQDALIEAIRDLTRVIIALNGQSSSKSDIVRKLDSVSMSPTRIAWLLEMKPKDVTSIISRARKKPAARKGKGT